MVSVPVVITLTTPVEEIVAVDVLVRLHTPPVTASPTVTVADGQKCTPAPVIDPAYGADVTVITLVVENVPQAFVIV